MGGGYALNLSDQTFGDFFDKYRVEIEAEHYRPRGTFEAVLMRIHWELGALAVTTDERDCRSWRSTFAKPSRRISRGVHWIGYIYSLSSSCASPASRTV